ncbi:MAG: hypothetical protein DA328_06655 [Nitrososphaeraceae archaeon]|nr:hypothetical protein [Nitrososphaeraceae archaeon]
MEDMYIPIKKILVPYDGDEISDKALSKAIEISNALKAKIFMIYVIDTRFLPPPNMTKFIQDKSGLKNAADLLINTLTKGAEKMLDTKMSKIKRKNIDIKFMVRIGSTADEIVSLAKTENADLIIMGSQQMKKEGTLGTVSRKVSEEANCPVMIINKKSGLK